MQITEGSVGKALLIKTRCLSLLPARAHACRQDEQQVAGVKYSNIGGDKTQTDEINRFLRFISTEAKAKPHPLCQK